MPEVNIPPFLDRRDELVSKTGSEKTETQLTQINRALSMRIDRFESLLASLENAAYRIDAALLGSPDVPPTADGPGDETGKFHHANDRLCDALNRLERFNDWLSTL